MKIVEIQKFGGPEVLQIIQEADAPPQAGQVAVDVKAAGINFADLVARSGTYPVVSSTPYRPGFEVAGVVTARGSGVDGIREGQHVMAWVQSGGYTSRILLNAQDVIPLPDSL